MIGGITAAATFGGAVAASVVATRAVLEWLERRAILDLPNGRSSHTRPTPRGGGLAVTAVAVTGWGALDIVWPGALPWPILACALALAALSWFDDLRGLGALPRFAMQIAAVMVGLPSALQAGPVLQGLVPGWLDWPLAALAWLWFVNLFNFMDGIDGMAGSESAAIGLGSFFLLLPSATEPALALAGLVVAGAAIGFLRWNWHPARVFLGDVGSIPLGYLLGWLLLGLASRGAWAAALILPLYYLADATLTLGRRAVRGERVWQAHRQHLYQVAVQRGLSHAEVMRMVIATNSVLLVLAVASVFGHPWMALVFAFAAVALLLVRLGTVGKR